MSAIKQNRLDNYPDFSGPDFLNPSPSRLPVTTTRTTRTTPRIITTITIETRPVGFRERLGTWCMMLLVAAMTAWLWNSACSNPFSHDTTESKIKVLEPGR